MNRSRISLLRQVHLLKHLTSPQLEELSWCAVQREVGRGAVIFSEGEKKEAIYFMLTGLVKTYHAGSNGCENNVAFLKERDVLPRDGLLAKGLYNVSAAAIVRTQLLMIPLEPFLNFLAANPYAAIAMLHAMQESVSELEDKLRETSWPGVRNPGQLFLLKLAEHYGYRTRGDLRIGIPMSHDHFASVIGTSRDDGDWLLHQLHEEGIAEMKRWGFVIHDVEALRRWRACEREQTVENKSI